VRISQNELGKAVPWLSGQSAQRVAVVQPEQAGIRVVTEQEVERAIAALGDRPTADRLEYAMFLSTRWPIEFKYEQQDTRYSFTLPEGARDAGLLPEEGGKVVVVAWGSLFEIWRAELWLKRFSPRLLTIEKVLDDLEEAPPEGEPSSP
jgi:hypothetical protein